MWSPFRLALGLARPRQASAPLGARGESLAIRTLKRKGYKLLGRNLRVPGGEWGGEADAFFLAPDRTTLVLVEVKTRIIRAGHSTPFAPGEAAVDADKLKRLRAILRHLQRANHWTTRPSRIDVVAIDWPEAAPGSPQPKPIVRHHEGIDRR